IRHRILPLSKEENPNFLKSIETLWQLGRIDDQYWSSYLSELPEPEDGRLSLHRKNIETLPRAARLRLFKHILSKIGPGQVLFETIMKMDEAYLTRKTGSIFQFPGNKTVRILRNEILFAAEP
ncbi:MAG: tRNA lysidine(34) synthetase TilS, partial [Desulfovibrionales bacterium]